MALIEKPFNALEKIIRAVFKGKPNVYADVDINAQILRQLYSLRDIQKQTGLLGSFDATNTSTYDSAGKLFARLTWVDFDVIFNSMRFQISAGSLNQEFVPTGYPQLRVYLIAKKKTVTFADDQTMSGVFGSSLEAPLPGAEHEVYYNERLGYGLDGTLSPTLDTDEEVICPIGSIIPSFNKNSGLLEPKFYSHTLSAYSTKVKNLLGLQSFSDTSIIELNQYLADYLHNYRAEPVGTVKMFVGDLAKFPGTGLGVNEWAGWARCNGSNGTIDFRDRSPIGFDERGTDPVNGIWDIAYNTLGGAFGEKTHVITKAEMARHNHTETEDFNIANTPSGSGPLTPSAADKTNPLKGAPLGGYGLIRRTHGLNDTNNNTAGGNFGSVFDQAGQGAEPDLYSTPMNIPFIGENQGHNTVHPVRVVLFIQRVF